MDLFVWAIRGLVVDRNGFGDMSARCIVHSRCTNGVVCAIEAHSVIWVSGPCEVLVGSDDREDLCVGIWDGEKDGVCAC